MRVVLLGVALAAAFASSAAALPLTFGVGDVVYKRETQVAARNAYGGKDIFGRKRTAATIEVRYLGLEGQTAVFARQDMKFLGDGRPNMMFGTVGSRSVMLAGPPRDPQAITEAQVTIRVDMASADHSLFVDGVTMEVVSATANRAVVDVPRLPTD